MKILQDSLREMSEELVKGGKVLLESERRFDLAMSCASEGLFDWDLKSGAFSFSPGLKRLLGYEPDDLENKWFSWGRLVRSDQLEECRRELEMTLSGGQDRFEQEIRMMHRNGHYIDTLFKGRTFFDRDGRGSRVVGTIVDISQLKENEQKLREGKLILQKSEARLEAAQKMAKLGSFEHHSVKGTIYWSREMYTILGFRIEDGLPAYEDIQARIHEDDRQKVDDLMDQVFVTGEDAASTCRFVMPDGTLKYISAHLTVHFDGEGVPELLCGTLQDITERRLSEMALEEVSRFRDRVIAETPMGLIIFDGDSGQCVAANKAIAEMVGGSNEVLLTLNFRELDSWKQTGLLESAERALVNGSRERLVTDVVTLFGKELCVDCHFASFSTASKRYLLAAVMDVTERAVQQRERERLEKQLLQAQKMESIGILAGGIAHDFNNILSSVIGFTELALQDAEPDSEQEDNLKEVFDAGNRARQLVGQILAFARQSDEVMQPVQPSSLVREVLKLIRSSIPTTIEIEQAVLSEACVMGNAIQLHQVLMNLCTNAAQAMRDAGGTLWVELRAIEGIRVPERSNPALPSLGAKEYLELVVADSGPGIEEEIIDNIFDPYFTTKKVGEGSGMGLAVVKGIVESHEGDIRAFSLPGKRTEFVVYLPVCEDGKDQSVQEPAALPGGHERILLVDDDVAILRMSSQILDKLGYAVTVCNDGADALERIRAHPDQFDLLLTDMTMPKMTGDRLSEEVKKIRPDLPIIICTGYSDRISESRAIELGVESVLYKPMTRAELADAVRRAVQQPGSRKDRVTEGPSAVDQTQAC